MPTKAEKFWNKVDRRHDDECWPWLGATNSKGYGTAGHRGLAHRVAWELTHGTIPAGSKVLHHCDNPRCCNAKQHLFLGTMADNTRDMIEKGRANFAARSNPGERNGRAKLSASNVLEIRRRKMAGEPGPAIAASFHISNTTLYDIVNRHTWKGV